LTTTSLPYDWTVWLRTQRRRVVDFLLGMLVVLGALGLAAIFTERALAGAKLLSSTRMYYTGAWLVILVIFLAKRLPDGWRAGGLLAMLYLFGVLSYTIGWLEGGARVFMMALLVVGGLLVNPRAGFWLAGLVVATYVAFAAAFYTGVLDVYWTTNMTRLSTIIVEGAGLLLNVGMVVASLWFFGQALTAATTANREAYEARVQLAAHADEVEKANHALQIAKEQAEAAREKAEEADRIKSQFLASMSHELRTPLNAILNFTEMTRDGVLGPVNEQQQDVLSKSLNSSLHLLSLINDVLDVTKIHSGMMRLFLEENVNLHDEISAVAAAAGSLVKGGEVRFITDIAPDLPLISADRRRVRQILLNLIGNAAKFTEAGTITLRAERIDDAIVFTVADTGPGISADDLARIFDSFVQTPDGVRQGGGTGLGLPLAKGLAEAHGGSISVESTPGKGSTFRVTLPIQPVLEGAMYV
jgi:signal transduction histidine kinase